MASGGRRGERLARERRGKGGREGGLVCAVSGCLPLARYVRAGEERQWREGGWEDKAGRVSINLSSPRGASRRELQVSFTGRGSGRSPQTARDRIEARLVAGSVSVGVEGRNLAVVCRCVQVKAIITTIGIREGEGSGEPRVTRRPSVNKGALDHCKSPRLYYTSGGERVAVFRDIMGPTGSCCLTFL
ncbi:hypothetical protein E2C01_020990 [Portunus trituberculatus]|uniref:Uncharacterized protein n=1 Tax=Portunus trituberculatus TaxID=210409 RepID=A0A5B7E3S5_PORTR|nr:hypothetical protein [Portunus trituberculatus]